MAKTVLIFLLAVAVVQSVYFYPQLPDTVASHFDGRGIPNGWMSKQVFCGIYLGIMILMVVIFHAIPKFPNQLRNIPNRDYWMSPERKEETMRYIDNVTPRMGIATMLLFIYVFHYAIEANLSPDPVLSGNVGWALILYFIFVAVWLFKFLRRFWRIPQ